MTTIKPSMQALLEFAKVAVASSHMVGGEVNEDARDAWALAEAMMLNMPQYLKTAVYRADCEWEANHG